MFLLSNPRADELICERCRKPLGKRQLDCPRYNSDQGEGCAYQITLGELADPRGGFLCGLGFIICIVAAWLLIRDGSSSPQIWIGNCLLALVGLGVILAGCYRIWGEWLTARNPESGQTWLRTSLFGVLVRWRWTSGLQLLEWAGSPARVMRYPASVAEFYREGSAADMIATGLLQLAAQRILVFGKKETQGRFSKRVARYFILKGEAWEINQPHGNLESRIVAIVAAGDPDGLSLADVTYALFEGGKRQLRNFLADTYVGPESVSLDLGSLIGERQRVLAPMPNSRPRIAHAIQSIEQLHRDFWITSPQEAAELLGQLDFHVLRMALPGFGLENQPD